MSSADPQKLVFPLFPSGFVQQLRPGLPLTRSLKVGGAVEQWSGHSHPCLVLWNGRGASMFLFPTCGKTRVSPGQGQALEGANMEMVGAEVQS